jgi:bacterial/archaeal transporter family protein
MKWLWLLVCVASSTCGDLMSARGMAERGEVEDFGPRGIARLIRYFATHRLVLAGLACNAISFVSFLALLSVSALSFAVPATAISYIFKTAAAQWYLRERVGLYRWGGALLVALGVYLLSQ